MDQLDRGFFLGQTLILARIVLQLGFPAQAQLAENFAVFGAVIPAGDRLSDLTAGGDNQGDRYLAQKIQRRQRIGVAQIVDRHQGRIASPDQRYRPQPPRLFGGNRFQRLPLDFKGAQSRQRQAGGQRRIKAGAGIRVIDQLQPVRAAQAAGARRSLPLFRVVQQFIGLIEKNHGLVGVHGVTLQGLWPPYPFAKCSDLIKVGSVPPACWACATLPAGPFCEAI